MADRHELVSLLNKALKAEFTDLFSYPKEAENIKIREIADTFGDLGRMELRHADILGTQIQALGGESKWDLDFPEIKESTEKILKDHLQREREAIQRYAYVINLLDSGDEDQLKIILRGIKAEEEEHVTTIQRLIDKYF